MRCSHNAKLWLALPWKSVNICQKRTSRYQHSIYRTKNWSRTNNSTEQITRVALVETTKQKVNPATDEVPVENRSHGLAWSQSGTNRTVARVLSYFKSYHQGRNYVPQSKDSHYLPSEKKNSLEQAAFWHE